MCVQGRDHGVDMSTPLLPEVVLRLTQIRWVFTGEEGVEGSVMVCSLTKYGEWSKFAASGGHRNLKCFQLQGLCLLTLWPGALLWTVPRWGSDPRPRYRLTLCVLAMRVHPTIFDLATPLCVFAVCWLSCSSALMAATLSCIFYQRRRFVLAQKAAALVYISTSCCVCF